MKYTVVSSSEFTYPDIFEYATSSASADIFSARNSYATTQILFSGMETSSVEIKFDGLPDSVVPEIYTLLSVPVERNERMNPADYRPHYPERLAPYRVYDCYRTFDGTLDLTDGQGGIYISIKVPSDAEPGVFDFSITVNGTVIPGKLQIYAAVVPEETLKMILGYRQGVITSFHGIEPDAPGYWEMEEKYLATLRRMHQNMMYTGGITHKVVGENKYEFDFSAFIEQVKRYDAAGMKYFQAPGIGFRRSWSASDILICATGQEAMSYEAYCYLEQYLPALEKVIKDNGWEGRFTCGVADEPNDANNTEFRALCGLIHKIAPSLRLLDAMSYGNLHGALDVWVPLNSEYDRHMKEMETLREYGGEIWHYVCCVPREPGYINRFLDYPLLSTRYLHWGNYKYNMPGFLHWAVNCYQPGQNPFEQNCPEHHNADSVGFLPAGDTHLIYPGTDGPWISARFEAERESAEDYELLKKLSETNKPLADEICDSVFHSFKDVEYDVNKFTAAKRRLLEESSKG